MRTTDRSRTRKAEAVEEATKRSAPLTDEEMQIALPVARLGAERQPQEWTPKAARSSNGSKPTEDRTASGTIAASSSSPSTAHPRVASRNPRLARLWRETVWRSFMAAWIREEREKVKAAFQTNPKDADVRILLATDAASEGIDLQNYCNCLIHIEIPYNPNVMEQRNGRIDRHGQKHDEVLIWHPVDGGEAAGDTRRPQGRHHPCPHQTGGDARGHGKRESRYRAADGGLIEGTRRELDTREAEARSAKAKRYVRAERQLKERIEKLHERLQETQKDFHLTPERIYRLGTTRWC